MNQEESARIDKELDTHFAEMGSKTEGDLAFLAFPSSEQGVDIRFDILQVPILDGNRLAHSERRVRNMS